jgi:hypothetical protein
MILWCVAAIPVFSIGAAVATNRMCCNFGGGGW